MVFQYQYTLNGDVAPAGTVIAHTYKTGNTFNSVEIELPISALTTYSIDIGVPVLIQYGTAVATTYYLFRGTVEDIKEAGSSAIIICYDKLYQLTKRLVNESYDSGDSFSGSIQEILVDLITTYGGLSADTNTIDAVSGAQVQEKLICIDAKVSDKVQDLLNVAQFIIYYNPDDDKVYAHEPGKTACSDTFSTGVNIVGQPTWNYDGSVVISKLSLHGFSYTTEQEDKFSGNGVTATFTLSYVPDNKANVNVVVDGTIQTFGVEGVTEAGYDYTIDDDPSIKDIEFTSGHEPGAGADNVVVTYARAEELYTERISDPVKDAYPLSDGGYREISLYNKYIKTVEDLEFTADAIMAAGETTYDSVNMVVTSLTKIPTIGEGTHITDTMNNEDRDMLIRKVSLKYPGNIFTLTLDELGGKPEDYLFTPQQRLTMLEESSRGNVSVIRKGINNNPIIDFVTTHLISIFNAWEDTWDITEDWDSAGTWGISNHSDDFSVDLTAVKWDGV
jgi:hypothetical protein